MRGRDLVMAAVATSLVLLGEAAARAAPGGWEQGIVSASGEPRVLMPNCAPELSPRGFRRCFSHTLVPLSVAARR